MIINGLSKSYANPVLSNISLKVDKGKIHAIVGANGAGKTTLVNIISGLVKKDKGEITLNKKPFEPNSPHHAFLQGVSVVNQELSIIPTLTVAENINLKDLPNNKGILTPKSLITKTVKILKKLGLEEIDPMIQANFLSLANQQMIEIAKALVNNPKILILDEPTSAIAANQADLIHNILKEKANEGTSIIYISHRLDDVLKISDKISVLRNGKVVLSAPTKQISVDDLINKMAKNENNTQNLTYKQNGKILIHASSLTTSKIKTPINFSGYAGEIIGISGLSGSGKSTLLKTLFGLYKINTGEITIHPNHRPEVYTNPQKAIKLGVAFVGEDRRTMGIFAGQSLKTNIMIPKIRSQLYNFINHQKEKKSANKLIKKLNIECKNTQQNILELSGGNQQKLILGRWFNQKSTIFLLDEPTRGIDINSKELIHKFLRNLANKGKCIIIASSENEELITLCTRIFVMSDYNIIRKIDKKSYSEKILIDTAFSEHKGSQVW